MPSRPFLQDILLVGFTALCGAGLTFVFQRMSADNMQKSSLQEARRTAATQLFQDVGRLMDRRIFLWSRMYGAFREGLADSVKQERVYRSTTMDWNGTVLTNQALICRYFGVKTAETFEQSIAAGFAELDERFQEFRKTPLKQRRGTNPLSTSYKSQRDKIYLFNLRLIDDIRSGTVGDYDAGQQCRSLVPADRELKGKR